MDAINNIARNNIKKYRKMRKMTQKELADALNITHSSVSAWEIGKNAIDMKRLNEICKVLDVSILEVLSETNNKETTKKDEKYNNILTYIEERPEVEMLLNVSKDSRDDDIMIAIKLLEAMKTRRAL